MNIQIIGRNNCFDTKKALRFFKERGKSVQYVDLSQRGLSEGELNNVLRALGGDIDVLINQKHRDAALIRYLTPQGKFEKLLEEPKFLKTPIVRCGAKATVGVAADIWVAWLRQS